MGGAGGQVVKHASVMAWASQTNAIRRTWDARGRSRLFIIPWRKLVAEWVLLITSIGVISSNYHIVEPVFSGLGGCFFLFFFFFFNIIRYVIVAYFHISFFFFSFQPVLHDWCNKGRGMCYHVCGMVHIKEPLLLIVKSSLCGDSGFPLSLSEGSLTICLTPYNRR